MENFVVNVVQAAACKAINYFRTDTNSSKFGTHTVKLDNTDTKAMFNDDSSKYYGKYLRTARDDLTHKEVNRSLSQVSDTINKL